jgi:hypothetical protein
MKNVALVIAFLFIFTLTACSGKPKEPVTNITTSPPITSPESQTTETPVEPENPDHIYQPERALPEGLPVYPGAVLTFDSQVWSGSDEETAWMWMYAEAGSPREILDYFTTELEKLGFEIEGAFADDYEVFLHDATETVSLGYSADDSDDLNQIGYMITVNLDKWDNR